MLTLPERLTEAVLENPAEATQFSTFALFSPDARLILTASAGEGRLQLWRAQRRRRGPTRCVSSPRAKGRRPRVPPSRPVARSS